MSEKTKNILTTIAISIVSLILVLIIVFLAYFNRWRFMKSVPESEYEEYIIGKWERHDGLIIEYTKDGFIKYYRDEKELVGSEESIKNWTIREGHLYNHKLPKDFLSLFGGAKIRVLNSKRLVLYYGYMDSYGYYTRIE